MCHSEILTAPGQKSALSHAAVNGFFLVHAHITPVTYLYPHCTELLRISCSLSLCVIFRAQLQSHCGKVPHSRHPVFSSAFLLHFFTNRGSADLLGPSGPKSLCICICTHPHKLPKIFNLRSLLAVFNLRTFC